MSRIRIAQAHAEIDRRRVLTQDAHRHNDKHRVLRRHRPSYDDVCMCCSDPWPCSDAAGVLDLYAPEGRR